MVLRPATAAPQRSLVDHLRENPPANHRMIMWGVDPDLRTLGWARVQVAYTLPAVAPASIEQVDLGLWSPSAMHKDSVEQANAMIGSLAHPEAPWKAAPQAALPTLVIAEAQRIYPLRDERPGTVVAKANDLLRLAQISGAFQSMFAHHGVRRARSFLPHIWKGQASKEAMHARVIAQLRATSVTVWQNSGAQLHRGLGVAAASLTKAKRKDALDGLCLALFGVDEVLYGRWVL